MTTRELEHPENGRISAEAPAPKVSVIVPVYNPGPGFERCLESLRGQTLADIEMIFVDDCGTDGAMEKVCAAASEDPRIRIITNPENMGPGPSRNRGIEAARGEYLAFVDADDYVSPDFLELLHTKAHAEGLDIAKGGRIKEIDGETLCEASSLNDAILSGLAAGRPLYALFTWEHQSGLYRRALLMESGARYGTSRKAQDVTFLLRVCHAARTIGIEYRATYHYIYRNSSRVNTFDALILKGQCDAFTEQCDYLVRRVTPDEYAVDYTLNRIRVALGMQAYAASLPEFEEAADKMLSCFREQALHLPFIESMKAKFCDIRALVDFGVGLAANLYMGGAWRNPNDARVRIGIAKRWCGFFSAHPELLAEYGNDFAWILKLSAEAVELETKYVPRIDINHPRIDVKIYGTKNSDLKLCGVSGKGARVRTPAWLYRHVHPGTGYIIEPYAEQTEITLDFVCNTKGVFTASLLGEDVCGEGDGQRTPMMVTYTELTCNGKVVFEGEQRAWHDQPYRFKKTVLAGDSVKLKICWNKQGEFSPSAKPPPSALPWQFWCCWITAICRILPCLCAFVVRKPHQPLPTVRKEAPFSTAAGKMSISTGHETARKIEPPACAHSPRVSVIVPVYNPGPGFERCLESLRGQTLADIEIIFVDDCGADGAMEEVRVVASDDPRIRVIVNPENLGPGLSRNAGIEAARGEYLSFVDADDYVSPDFLELLYHKAHTEGLDIAKGTAVYMMDGLPKQKDFVWNAFIRSGLAQGKPLYRLFMGEHWTGLYRRALLMESGARYGTSRKAQDTTFLLRVCHVARTFGIEGRATYHYVYRESSTVNTFDAQILKEQCDAFTEQCDYLVWRVTQDEHAEFYAFGRIEWSLGMQAYAAKSPGLAEAAAELLAGLREQTLRLPFIESMKARSFAIRALVDYGVGLGVKPYPGLWEELDTPRARLDLAKRWCDFTLAHPELAHEYGKDLSQVLQKAAGAVKREKNYGPRIDVKIYGTENSELELRGVSGKGAKVETPEWLRKLKQPGVGYVVLPHVGQTEISLDFVCKTGGEFTAELRGADVKDGSGKRIPMWVTYTGLTCNGEVVFAGEQRAWHDQPYRYQKTVTAGEAVNMIIRWNR